MFLTDNTYCTCNQYIDVLWRIVHSGISGNKNVDEMKEIKTLAAANNEKKV